MDKEPLKKLTDVVGFPAGGSWQATDYLKMLSPLLDPTHQHEHLHPNKGRGNDGGGHFAPSHRIGSDGKHFAHDGMRDRNDFDNQRDESGHDTSNWNAHQHVSSGAGSRYVGDDLDDGGRRFTGRALDRRSGTTGFGDLSHYRTTSGNNGDDLPQYGLFGSTDHGMGHASGRNRDTQYKSAHNYNI